MPSPVRRACVVDGPTPCSSYTLERKLLRAYHALYQQQVGSLWHPATRLAAQVAALGGLDRAATRNGYAEARLTEAMPELIQRLTPAQQPELAALLLTDAPDLAAVVQKLVQLERNLNYRDDDPRLRIPDDARLKAAGLGRLSQQQYGKPLPLGPPLELTSPPARVVLRTKKKAATRRASVPRLAPKGQLALWPPVGVLLAGLVQRVGL